MLKRSASAQSNTLLQKIITFSQKTWPRWHFTEPVTVDGSVQRPSNSFRRRHTNWSSSTIFTNRFYPSKKWWRSPIAGATLGGIYNSDPWGVHWRVVVELRDEYVFFEPVLVQIGYVEANLEFNALAHAMMNKDRHARGNTIPSHYTRYHCSPAKMCDRHTKTITRVYGKQVPGSSTCNLHCIQFVINLLKKVRSGVSFFIKDCVPEEKEVYHLYCEDPSLCADPHPYTGTQHWDPKHVWTYGSFEYRSSASFSWCNVSTNINIPVSYLIWYKYH